MTDRLAAVPGALVLRPPPPGMPEPTLAPPVIAQAGDAFASLRILDLLARVERGRPVRLDDVVGALNARHLDWLFDRNVVVATCIALQANWFADYRNHGGIVLDEGDYGLTLAIEDSARVDPWIARQAQRVAAACRGALDEFSRRDV